ncbi:MAG: flavodoxin domain-containing protein [Candidatus Heimdallarchaeaceae archaeon]
MNKITDKKVLILYGTRFGATEEVAEKLKEMFEKKEIKTDIFDLKKVKNKNLPEINNYDGVVIGTGIKMSMWVKEVKNYLNKEKEKLKQYSGKKAFFISSAFAAQQERYDEIKKQYIIERIEKLGLEFQLIEAFGGKLDLSDNSRMGWLDKKIASVVAKEHEPDMKNNIVDFRDWKKVEKFANDFIELIIA